MNSGSYHFKKPLNTMEEKKNECTLSNSELIDKVCDWVTKLSASGGTAWCLRVPADMNEDPDMLILELVKRFKKKW